MNDLHFDRLTRRASITTLGVAGLAAFASPFTATAKRKHKKANTKQRKHKNANTKQATANTAIEKCQTQVGQCTDFISAACPGDAACVAKLQPCCTFSGQCDFTGFINCLQQAASV
jgi:hypothetical protein